METAQVAATGPEVGCVVRFVPFAPTVESSFWVRYCQEKLDTIKLSEEPIPISASYALQDTNTNMHIPRLQLQESSLRNDWNKTCNECIRMTGVVRGFNTIESFQKADKNQLLKDWFCPKFLHANDDPTTSTSTSTCLTSFLLLTYADLKNHKILYWFAVPSLLPKYGIRATRTEWLCQAWTTEQCDALSARVESMRRARIHTEKDPNGCPPFFVATHHDDGECQVLSQQSYNQLASSGEKVFFGFFDPVVSTFTSSGDGGGGDAKEQAMGWPMRNLIAYLSFHLALGGKSVSIMSCRPRQLHRIYKNKGEGEKGISTLVATASPLKDSILLTVIVPMKENYTFGAMDDDETNKYRVVGWEPNARSKPGPRWVNLRPLLDDKHLAVQAADLNLKLMKWRMIPSLDVALLQKTRVLIVGAGTLGCSVARVLLGWGIRDISFVDYGHVSHSNPVRQNVFTLDDCNDNKGSSSGDDGGGGGGGRPKAVAAAEALHSIAADARTKAYQLSIPMPGHAESDRERLEEIVVTLDRLVQECDVVYLLTDTRESRWLPTVMAAAHNKPLLNAALGLDGWLVIRHGGSPFSLDEVDKQGRGAGRLGCYFCNDVVAPENSMKNRTLDQQCTVTRPGLAPIASSMVVELMVALLHHPQRHAAPAPKSSRGGAFRPTNDEGRQDGNCPLGVIPHQIRGSLVTYTMMTPTVPAFCHCTGCSAPIVNAYQTNKVGVVYEACQSQDGSYLENLSGLTAFRAEAASKMVDVEDWEDDE